MRAKIKSIVDKTKDSYRKLPEKKQHVEFFTTLLSVPVLLTVIILNVNNLRAANAKPQIQPTSAPVKEIVYLSPQSEKKDSETQPTPTPTKTDACKREIGPIDIKSPKEGDTITQNPVYIVISQDKGDYCAVVWAYRLNGGSWSDYDDKSIALYNLPSGQITFELKVKSIVTGEEKVLTRKFTYRGIDQQTNSASSSAQ